jgi:hypothetical protein
VRAALKPVHLPAEMDVNYITHDKTVTKMVLCPRGRFDDRIQGHGAGSSGVDALCICLIFLFFFDLLNNGGFLMDLLG